VNEPDTTLDQRFSDPDAAAAGWEQTRRVLEEAQLSWICTVRADGRPHLTPLVAVWLDGALYFCTGAGEQKAVNLRVHPHVLLLTGCHRWDEGLDVVAEGDMSVRVPVTGNDELGELARAFNDMIGEMAESRARIEFLQRMGAWQEMAQRLAHEIKNPLTPIQLAVQECHRKYGGDDSKFRALLDTTLEIVEEEVGTLRRLVGDFSNFARLPQAELRDADLRDFLREMGDQLAHIEEAAGEESMAQQHNIDVRLDVPEAPLPAAIDRQMLRRVLVNLVRNAAQAIRDARAGGKGSEILGHVVVSAGREGEGVAMSIEDDGPGVPNEARERVFDPYFTTKSDGR